MHLPVCCSSLTRFPHSGDMSSCPGADKSMKMIRACVTPLKERMCMSIVTHVAYCNIYHLLSRHLSQCRAANKTTPFIYGPSSAVHLFGVIKGRRRGPDRKGKSCMRSVRSTSPPTTRIVCGDRWLDRSTSKRKRDALDRIAAAVLDQKVCIATSRSFSY